MCNSGTIERRSLLKAAGAFCRLSTLAVIAPGVAVAAQESGIQTVSSSEVRLEDVSAGPNTKITIERRGQIVLFGIHRPYIQNRIDPETFEKLAEAYFQYDNDPSLLAAILFGHAEELSNTVMTVEIGGPTESAKMIDRMWFHTMPGDSWAVGGRFDDTYVKGRKMALAHHRPQGLMDAELKSRGVKEVARVLKAALGVGREDDDTGIFTMLIEIDDGQWANGGKILSLFQLIDDLGGNVSEQRRGEMSARYPQKR